MLQPNPDDKDPSEFLLTSWTAFACCECPVACRELLKPSASVALHGHSTGLERAQVFMLQGEKLTNRPQKGTPKK